MARKARGSVGVAMVLALAFVVLGAIFLDTLWVLGQKVRMHASGEPTKGRIIATTRTQRKGYKGGTVTSSVSTYEYQDATGRTWVGQTGRKSVLFAKPHHSPSKVLGPNERAPKVTLLYLRDAPSVSWAVNLEPGWSDLFFLSGLLLFLLLVTGGGAFLSLKGDAPVDRRAPVAAAVPAVRPATPPGGHGGASGRGRKRKRRGRR